jgi:hypothetical protein
MPFPAAPALPSPSSSSSVASSSSSKPCSTCEGLPGLRCLPCRVGLPSLRLPAAAPPLLCSPVPAVDSSSLIAALLRLLCRSWTYSILRRKKSCLSVKRSSATAVASMVDECSCHCPKQLQQPCLTSLIFSSSWLCHCKRRCASCSCATSALDAAASSSAACRSPSSTRTWQQQTRNTAQVKHGILDHPNATNGPTGEESAVKVH